MISPTIEPTEKTVVCFGCVSAQRVAALNDVACTCGMCGATWLPEPSPTADPAAGAASGECPGCIEARGYLERIRDTRSRNAEMPESDSSGRSAPVRLARCRNGWTYCEECGEIVALDERGRQAAFDATVRRARDAEARLFRRRMLDEFDNLARWRPYLEGKGTEPSPIVGDGNRGGGAKLSATDRPDWVNEAGSALARATETADRLERLRSAARVDAHQRSVQRTTVGARIRRLREQLGLSREELGERIVFAQGEDSFAFDVTPRPGEHDGLFVLRWLQAFTSALHFYEEIAAKWVALHEDAPGFVAAAADVHILAPALHRDEEELREHLSRDDSPPPTDLERGVAVLQWLSQRVGSTQRKNLVSSIGQAFGGRAAAEDLHARRAELVRRRQIVPMKPEAVAAERERIARDAAAAIEEIRQDKARVLEEMSANRGAEDHRIGEWAARVSACNSALTQAFTARMREADALDAKVAEGRRALTPEGFRAALARLPSAPTAEAVKVMGAELLALAEKAWRGDA